MIHLLFPSTPRSAVVRYGLAVVSVLMAFAIRDSLEHLLFDQSPLLLFVLPVALMAMAAGAGPALFAAILGAFLGSYFFEPYGVFAIHPEHVRIGMVQMGVFLLTSGVIAYLGAKLRALRAHSEESAHRLDEILTSITDGFVALDQNFRFLYINETAERMTGRPRRQMQGRTFWEEFHELRGRDVEERFRGVAGDGRPVHFEHYASEARCWYEVHAYPAASGGLTVYFRDVSVRKTAEERLRQTLAERDAALENVRLLTGLLPICAGCKSIRNEKGEWQQMEAYISAHSEAQFTHGMCPSCMHKWYGEYAAREPKQLDPMTQQK
jgi:PAS domain S-box-containing protein